LRQNGLGFAISEAKMETARRFLRSPDGSFFLFGPRGTGKSTWLQATLPDALRVDLLDPESQRLYQARPERLRELVAGHPKARDIVIDEIQKVPSLLDVVHQLVEADRGKRFILTGSSARKLRRGAANLLAGRLVQAEMHPFMAAEVGDAFSLRRALTIGLVPLVWMAPDPAATLRAYASLYLREEVQAEALVRDIGGFARFLEAISFSHGSLLNLAEVARECQVGRKTVEGYLGILEDLLLSFRVPVFTRRAQRHLVAHDKFYYFDAGVFRSLRPAGPLDRPEEIEGLALEGLVAQHLRAWMAYRSVGERLYYWRTKAGNEVDFVVYGPDIFAAWEVKRAARVQGADLRSLKAFREDYPEARLELLYLGKDRLEIDGIAVTPCETFLRQLVAGHSSIDG
jgi:predicted AAA+ superfamily ATPase